LPQRSRKSRLIRAELDRIRSGFDKLRSKDESYAYDEAKAEKARRQSDAAEINANPEAR
jgi:hypothetical protein